MLRRAKVMPGTNSGNATQRAHPGINEPPPEENRRPGVWAWGRPYPLPLSASTLHTFLSTRGSFLGLLPFKLAFHFRSMSLFCSSSVAVCLASSAACSLKLLWALQYNKYQASSCSGPASTEPQEALPFDPMWEAFGFHLTGATGRLGKNRRLIGLLVNPLHEHPDGSLGDLFAP